MEKQREQARLRKQRQRDRERVESVTSGERDIKSVTSPEKWYPNKPTDERGQPITPVVLSDGQLWYPKAVASSGLSPDILADIEREGKRRGDTEERLARAIKYKEWIDDGKPLGNERSIKFDNGSYLAVDKLVSQRKLLTYLSEHLKYQDNIRVGVSGPTIAEIKPLLSITA